MINYKIFSDKGDREINEDFAVEAVSGESMCFVLCDGLGGHGKGEVASELVAKCIKSEFESCSDIDCFLPNAIEKAQNALLDEQKKTGATFEMKTTAVVLVIHNNCYAYGHIGDSRLYILNDSKISKRTVDHSVPQMLCLAGDIKEKQIRNHPDRNRLLRVMGVEWDGSKYELSDKCPLKGNESFLLCSDGFWELINEKEMQKTSKKTNNVDEWLDMMTKIVKENGVGKNMDNYTAIVVRISQDV